MLKKLLKYDIGRMKRLWRVYAIVLPIIAVVLALSFRFFEAELSDYEDVNVSLDASCILSIIICIFATVASAVINSVFLAKHMGHDFFSDAGQLTFTLPVKREDLFLSKLLNSLIWITASNLHIVLTVLLCFLVSPSQDNTPINMEVVDQIQAFFSGAFSAGILGWITVMLLAIIAIEINVLMPNLLNYCVIKCQSSGGMGMYIGLLIGGIFGVTMIVGMGTNGYTYILGDLHDVNYTTFAILSLVVATLALAVLNFALFMSARDRIKHNFNLC